MQTFLPYPEFSKSASVLDNKRLGKQRAECKQIYNALAQGPKCMYSIVTESYIYGPILDEIPKGFVIRATPWYNHPATKMWKGYEYWLALYGWFVSWEWRANRNFNDTLVPWFADKSRETLRRDRSQGHKAPPWLGNEDFHRSHQSNLIRKLPSHYANLFPGVPDNLPYVWPKPSA